VLTVSCFHFNKGLNIVCGTLLLYYLVTNSVVFKAAYSIEYFLIFPLPLSKFSESKKVK
jgi:hypothetical protein